MQISSSEISSMELLNISNLKQNTAGISVYFFNAVFCTVGFIISNIKYLPI